MGKSPGLELKNKMASLGFKKMAFQDGVELTPFLAFDFFLGMMSGRKTSSHSQWYNFLKTPTPWGPGTCIQKQDGVVGV